MKSVTLAQQVLPASLVILAASLVGLGWWAGRQIEQGVVTQRAGEVALYVSRLMSPPLPELAQGAPLTQEHIDALQRLVGPTPAGHTIVAFKIWDPQGRIIYSTLPGLIGKTFPLKDKLTRALQGEVVYGVSDLTDGENTLERGQWDRLLEVYNPVQDARTGRVTAVVELYQTVEALELEARQAQISSWLVFGGAMGGAYLLLAAMVQRGSRAATRQKATLSEQVAQLYGRLGTADEMHLRTRRGAGGAAAAYERSLRQFGDELRAGPAQQLSYALLQLDRALTQARSAPAEGAATPPSLETIDQALRQAYAELGSIAERYAAPALEGLTLAEAVRRAAGAHQQRARAAVEVDLDDWPEQAPGGIKTALYRFVRSSLMQIQRQAGGDRQRVAGRLEEDALQVEIYDAGPQRMAGAARSEDQLAWAEARSYVESMGGVFSLASGEGPGPRVRAEIPLPGPERYRWT